MAKPTKEQVDAARKARAGYMKTRGEHIAAMKKAYKAGNKAEAKKWRDKAIAVANKARGQADIMLSAKDAKGLKAHAEKANAKMTKRVEFWKKKVSDSKGSNASADIQKKYQKALDVVLTSQKKRKNRYATLSKGKKPVYK